MASVAYVDGLAAMMATHQQSLPSYDKQLHTIYLANDVLLKRCDYHIAFSLHRLLRCSYHKVLTASLASRCCGPFVSAGWQMTQSDPGLSITNSEWLLHFQRVSEGAWVD